MVVAGVSVIARSVRRGREAWLFAGGERDRGFCEQAPRRARLRVFSAVRKAEKEPIGRLHFFRADVEWTEQTDFFFDADSQRGAP
jgi:hypothetical protein